MISGYLITGSLIAHRDALAFLRDRIIRIYPAFLGALLPIFLVGPFVGFDYFSNMGPLDWLVSLGANLLFLPGLAPLKPALLVAWTLSYEAAFYLLGALTLAVWMRDGRLGRATAMMAAVLFCWAYPRALFFLVGVLLHAARPQLAPVAVALRWLAWPGLLAILVGVGVELEPSGTVAARTGHDLPFALALAGSAAAFAGAQAGSSLSSVLSWRVFQGLGTISYSLYLWHTPVMFITKRLTLKVVADPVLATLVFAATSLAIVLPLSWLSYRLLEVGAARLLRRWWGAGSARGAATPGG